MTLPRHASLSFFPTADNCLMVGGNEVGEALLVPAFMVQAQIVMREAPLPRNPNGKIDRKALAGELAGLFTLG